MGKSRLIVVVIVDDLSLASLLKEVLTDVGHDVRVFSNPMLCTVYREHKIKCHKNSPCADVIIADQDLPRMKGLDFFSYQKDRGCVVPDGNKAILLDRNDVSYLSSVINRLGCKAIIKPFKSKEILEWINECGVRQTESAID